jgi:drug/metabolite transporter (DMT)-like permease
MSIIYKSIHPLFLLIAGLILVAGASVLKGFNETELPLINVIFVLVGAGSYFLPVMFCEKEEGERLRRKLLWLLVLAGFLILAGEVVRGWILSRNV